MKCDHNYLNRHLLWFVMELTTCVRNLQWYEKQSQMIKTDWICVSHGLHNGLVMEMDLLTSVVIWLPEIVSWDSFVKQFPRAGRSFPVYLVMCNKSCEYKDAVSRSLLPMPRFILCDHCKVHIMLIGYFFNLFLNKPWSTFVVLKYFLLNEVTD